MAWVLNEYGRLAVSAPDIVPNSVVVPSTSTDVNFVEAVAKQFSGLKVDEEQIKTVVRNINLDIEKPAHWSDNDILKFAKGLRRESKPMIIAANKIKGVRAVAIYDKKSAVHAREHDDANIISISADWTNENQEKEILLAFLNASFTGEERHIRRIKEIAEFEK